MKWRRQKLKIFKCLLLVGIMFAIGLFIYHKELLRIYYPREYKEAVERYSKEFGVDEKLVYSIIKNESGFDENAESATGARGLMQIMPPTADWIEGVKNFGYKEKDQLFQSEINIKMGCWYLKNLLEEFHDVEKAIAAYNAGRGNVAKWLKNEEYTQENKLIFIPFKETDVYLKRVMFSHKMYNYIYD